MARRDISFTVALCISLSMHGFALIALIQQRNRDLTALIAQPPLALPHDNGPIFIPEPPPPPARAQNDDNSEWGDAQGRGYAMNSSPTEGPALQAKEGPDDQAFLSRDPEGPGRVGNPPSPSLEPAGQGGSGALAALPSPAPTDQPPILRSNSSPAIPPVPLVILPKHAPMPIAPNPAPDRGADKTLVLVPPAPSPAAPPSPEQPQAPATPAAAPGKPGSPVPPADPAPASDTESDPFSRIGSVDFRPGRMDARFGRKIKAVRPRLTLTGEVDLESLRFPSLTLQLKIDATGKVTDARVSQSSGSNEIDQPCLVAVYDWWIEPPKDKAGKPIPSELELHITWHGS